MAAIPSVIRGSVSPLEAHVALLEYLRSMREIVDAQRQVMLRFLGDAAPLPLVAAVPAIAAPAPRLPAALPVAASPAAAEARPARRSGRVTRPPPPAPRADLTPLQALTAIVSERTGYPIEMLEADLDLEADLGVDSIKRIEILGQLRDRLGLGAMSEAGRSDALEELAKIKTLRKIGEWLEARAA